MTAAEMLNKAKQALSQGDGNLAVSLLNDLLRAEPHHAEGLYLLALCADLAGQKAEAERLLEAAYDAGPQVAAISFALGTYIASRDPDRSMDLFRAAVASQPDFAPAWTAMGNQCRSKGLLGAARENYENALRADPALVEVETNLGAVLHDQFAHDEALARHDRAQAAKPDLALAHSNKLLGMHYSDAVTADRLFAEHLAWADRIQAQRGAMGTGPGDGRDVDPDRRLRVGYVSPDFRVHPVGWFFLSLLERHRPEQVETFCYAANAQQDRQTDLIRVAADHWRPCSALDDKALEDLVRRDGIDILVDLAGHTGGNRLPVFAGRPAPVQVTWLGYPDTTGLQSVDYRLTDEVTDPDGSLASEELVQLEGGFLCYRAPVVVTVDKSVRQAGGPVFASFNNLAKLNDAVVSCWSEILTRLPDARLILKSRALADPDTRSRCVAAFGSCGVNPERIDLRERTPDLRDSFAAYNEVDVALDPFPYNGTTTTFDALWMGTPVVTLAGDRHSGRVGASILTHMDQTDLIAKTPDAYIDLAIAVASDRKRLADLARSLRPRLENSPWMDGAGFAEKIESAYRGMWRRWCASNGR